MDGFWVCLTVRGVIEGSPELAWLRDQFPPPGKYQSACCVLSTRYNNNNTHVHTYSKQAHKCSNVCAYMHAHASNCREVSEVKPEKAFKIKRCTNQHGGVCVRTTYRPLRCVPRSVSSGVSASAAESRMTWRPYTHIDRRPMKSCILSAQTSRLQGGQALQTHTRINVKCVLIYRHVITIHTDINATNWISAVRGALRLNFLLN